MTEHEPKQERPARPTFDALQENQELFNALTSFLGFPPSTEALVLALQRSVIEHAQELTDLLLHTRTLDDGTGSTLSQRFGSVVKMFEKCDIPPRESLLFLTALEHEMLSTPDTRYDYAHYAFYQDVDVLLRQSFFGLFIDLDGLTSPRSTDEKPYQYSETIEKVENIRKRFWEQFSTTLRKHIKDNHVSDITAESITQFGIILHEEMQRVESVYVEKASDTETQQQIVKECDSFYGKRCAEFAKILIGTRQH